jgi:maleate cis-trans isomerase
VATFGWRARIGLVSPGTNGVHTSALEMEMLAPDGVLFVSRFLEGPRSLALDDQRAMLPQLAPAAKAIAETSDVDLILAAGAPVVLANDPASVIETITEATGLPATTNVSSLVAGLRRLGTCRVAVVMPYYPDEVVGLVLSFLEREGIEILSVLGGAGVEFRKHKELSQQATYRSAKRAFLSTPGAEALVIVGGGAPLHEVIGTLETDIGAPVVANNFASLWNVLTMASVREPIEGYGRLLTLF